MPSRGRYAIGIIWSGEEVALKVGRGVGLCIFSRCRCRGRGSGPVLILHLLLRRTDWKKRTGATKASEWAGPSSFHRGGDSSLAGFAGVKRMRSAITRVTEDSDRKPSAPRGCNGCWGSGVVEILWCIGGGTEHRRRCYRRAGVPS